MRPFPVIPKVIGHRGAAADAPENTLLSIREAHRQGSKMVEFDVKLTGGANPVPVLFHDETLERTTNGRGRLQDFLIEDLQRLDAGRGEIIPRLVDVIALLTDLDMAANIEIKPCPGRAVETAMATIEGLKQYWPPEKAWPIISSFQIDSLKIARDHWPDCPRGYLIDRRPDDWRSIASDLGAATLHVGHRHETPETIAEYINFGLPVLVYTVNDPDHAKALWHLGVQAVFTDCPGHILAIS